MLLQYLFLTIWQMVVYFLLNVWPQDWFLPSISSPELQETPEFVAQRGVCGCITPRRSYFEESKKWSQKLGVRKAIVAKSRRQCKRSKGSDPVSKDKDPEGPSGPSACTGLRHSGQKPGWSVFVLHCMESPSDQLISWVTSEDDSCWLHFRVTFLCPQIIGVYPLLAIVFHVPIKPT